MWRCLHDGLPTRDRFIRYLNNDESACPLSGNHDESMNHLFIDCDLAKRIWFGMDNNVDAAMNNINLLD